MSRRRSDLTTPRAPTAPPLKDSRVHPRVGSVYLAWIRLARRPSPTSRGCVSPRPGGRAVAEPLPAHLAAAGVRRDDGPRRAPCRGIPGDLHRDAKAEPRACRLGPAPRQPPAPVPSRVVVRRALVRETAVAPSPRPMSDPLAGAHLQTEEVAGPTKFAEVSVMMAGIVGFIRVPLVRSELR